MGLRETFLKILAIDTPPKRPNVEDYCAVEHERLTLEHERDVYKRELMRLGYRPEHLAALLNTAGTA